MDFFEKAWPFAESTTAAFTHLGVADKNRLRILGLLARRRCLSQRQLTIATGLQASTVSNIVRYLKEIGIIRDGAAIEADRAGPKETQIEIIPHSLWSVGVSLDPLGHRLSVMNACGHIMTQESLPPGIATPDLLATLPERIRECATRVGLDPAKLGGMGISVPGVVDAETGTVLISRALHLEQTPLREPLEKALGCPVWIERNVTCGAYAEHNTGAARDHDSFTYFLLRSDPGQPMTFGIALVMGEKIFHGCNSAAGEVDRNLLSSAFNLLPADGQNTAQIATAFYAALGDGLTGITNLLDINNIVICSNDEHLTPDRFRQVAERISAGLIPVPRRQLNLLRSSLGIDGPLLGAALLALHRALATQLAGGRAKSGAGEN